MVTINPAECKPGEVYEGTVHGERTVLIRRDACDSYPWESLDEVLDHEDVSSLVRLVPARPITRDDLPRVADVRGPAETPSAAAAFYAVDEAFDAVVEHLNRRFPKVPPVLVMPDSERPESEVDRWRRAHEIVEQERDQAREERDEAQMSERESQELRARMRELLDGVSNAVNPPEPPLVRWGKHDLPEKVREVVRDRDEWRARAVAAEARTAPDVTRADVAESLARCLDPEMWNVTFLAVVNEICDLFGIETEQAVDPVEGLAERLYAEYWGGGRAHLPWSHQDEEGREGFLRIAAHVLGQEAK